YILNNMNLLGVDINKIEKIVISHNHWDHLGGLWELLKINKNIEIFACLDFLDEFKDKIEAYDFKLISSSQKIIEGVYTTGDINIETKDSSFREQALVIKTEKGISVICACSHDGILKFICKVKEMFVNERIYSLIGGYHLIDMDKRTINYVIEEIKQAGVENVGPSHCTGFEAISLLKANYTNNFFEIKVGVELEL
ncbi:MAG: MBL fold metallo-hydrolase, partial [Candidatus Omnitrophica bacterium]|nr:MBL fold metallo-hydrolase [Candidatus Omnitrophota bacterium]